ncbi:MAG: ABC transporter permease [Anaerolineae bacterium]|nr:ABC transporter permease [Anaerolineae bacterium]
MATSLTFDKNDGLSARERARAMQDRLDIEREPVSYWDMVWFQLRKDKLTLIAFAILLILSVLSYSSPLINQYILKADPDEIDLFSTYQAPSKGHWLGLDELGRDQLARLLSGGRISLSVGILGAALIMTIGVFFGAVAGYFGGAMDDVIMWFINTMSSIPFLLFLIIVCQLFKPKWYVLVIFIALNAWMGTARLVRGQVLSVKERDYVLAARALGVPISRIIASHVLPNVIPIVIIQTAGSIGGLILTESALSFLGLGVQLPTATWGNMLTKAQSYFTLGSHLVIFPGLLITTTVLCLFLIGDGLRDALDPMMRGR